MLDLVTVQLLDEGEARRVVVATRQPPDADLPGLTR